jgi:hypothetical protein
MGNLVYQTLDEQEKTLLRDLGGDLDLMYNFLPNAERNDLYKRAFGKDYVSSDLFNIEIPKKIKGSPQDRRDYQLQMDAKMLANQAVQVQRAVLAGQPQITHTYIRDIILKASEIGSKGTMMRLWNQNPQIAQVLQYSHENKVLTGRMLEEYKKFKPAYKNAHPFAQSFSNPQNGFALANFLDLKNEETRI